MSGDAIKKVKFADLDVNDSFFESLVQDYPGFEDWFNRKSDETAYIINDDNNLRGFLYLKDENEADDNISPPFPMKKRLKIGTFKIDAHGTVLGQRFLGIALRKMIDEGFSEAYVTLFERQTGLVNLFEKFGFEEWGNKNNDELVYVKNIIPQNDIYCDFPRFLLNGNNKYLLGIYPEFHTKIFPESKLKTEKAHMIEDLSFTNTIEKIYITKIDIVKEMKHGDLILIYRTREKDKSAEYSAVATSVCTVIDVKTIDDFSNLDAFLSYCGKGSIFTDNELKGFWETRRYPIIIKMLYNVPLNKRLTRRDLIEDIGLGRDEYWGCFKINDIQFDSILKEGHVSESFIID